MIENKQSILAQNTVFLYFLTFSNQLLGLLTIPYLTRVLGPSSYGKLGMALSLMAYVQLILDFGFILSATNLISQNRDDTDFISKVFSAVTYVKSGLCGLSGILFLGLCQTIPSWRTDTLLYMLFFTAYSVNAFLPDFLYRGKEQMKIVTVRTVGVKVLFTCFIFLMVKNENDLIKYPVILGSGNLIAVMWSFVHVHKAYGVKLCRVQLSYVRELTMQTLPFFISRIATTFYQAATTVILGTMYSGQAVVGYFSAADKLLSAVKAASSPVADSLYPYMTKNKDYKLVGKIMILTIPIITVTAVVAFLFAKPVCVLLFGEEYTEAANVLRCLIPAMAVIFHTYIISFPVLVPIGLSRYANFSNVLGAILQVVFLVTLYITKQMNVYSICICGSSCEVIVFLFRLGVALRYRDRINKCV